MKKLLLLFLLLIITACTAAPATKPGIPVTGDTPTSRAQGNPEVGQVQANGITIAYESFGFPDAERETILLIGGTGQQLVDWPLELVNALVGRGYRVVRFDNRDIGLSTKLSDAGLPDVAAVGKALQEGKTPQIPYTVRDMANDTVGLLDTLGIERAHLVGASMGGAIEQWVAIDHPERVLSLTTIFADSGNPKLPIIANPEAFANVPPQPTTADKEAFINWQVKTFQVLGGSTYPTDEPTLREWAERDFERGFDPAGLVRQQTAILVDYFDPNSERRNNLEKITAPTVIIHGTEDPLVPMASAEDLAARIPNAELRVIPGLGHSLPAELIPQISDAIQAAVQRATQTDIPVTALPSPVESPERVAFETGANSAQRSSLLPSGYGVKQYVLTGNAGQTMTVDVFSDDVPLSMTITMPNGMQRIPEMSPADGGGYRVGHEFTLPEPGDYIVTLTKADHTPSTNYAADFAIK
jgi:pimeloyl-ACP methyl ester carboxylesterase